MHFIGLDLINNCSITKEYKVKSLEQWWFLVKGSTTNISQKYEYSEVGVYIESYSLVHINFN